MQYINFQSNELNGWYICEISKLTTLKWYMNWYDIEYKLFDRISPTCNLTNEFWFTIKKIFEIIETTNVDMAYGFN